MTGRLLRPESHGGPVDAAVDFAIVGSGPGGAAAARVLAAAGFSVLVLEQGLPYPPEARRADAFTAFGAAWKDAGFQVARGRAVTPLLQGVALGGSTPINGAILHRLPAPVADGWRTTHGLGALLAPAELDRVFARLDAEVGATPTPPAIAGQNNLRLAAAAAALGVEARPTVRAAAACVGSARCNQGCPTGAKSTMDQTLLPRAMADGATIFVGCRVTGLRRAGGRVTGVDARLSVDGRPGPPVRVEARRGVLLALGAIHTPLLLAAAGLGGPRVGRNLRAHPGASLLARFDDEVRLFEGATQGQEVTGWWAQGYKCETVGLPPAVLLARIPGFGPDLMARAAAARHLASWGVQIRARTEGRVRRLPGGLPWVTWDLQPEDVRLFWVALQSLGRLAFAAGARGVSFGVPGLPVEITSPDGLAAFDALPADPRLLHTICAHLFGTAALGADPARAVLTPTGAVRGVSGLSVVDASALPTNMGVNPQHTICAVSWRIAEGLAGS